MATKISVTWQAARKWQKESRRIAQVALRARISWHLAERINIKELGSQPSSVDR